jgi:hypothetical protein
MTGSSPIWRIGVVGAKVVSQAEKSVNPGYVTLFQDSADGGLTDASIVGGHQLGHVVAVKLGAQPLG